VRDGQEAIFSTARDEPYRVVTVDGNTQTTLEDVRFLNVGVNLSVTPTINDEDFVTLDVLLEISDLVEIRDDIPIVGAEQETVPVLEELYDQANDRLETDSQDYKILTRERRKD
jgi:type II secretory pathway component GspD/PulD (secretin)